jgi:hypothetical protein
MIGQGCGRSVPERAWKTLRKLSRHDISRWALAGGLAVEIHCSCDGVPTATRRLSDIDFVTASFDCIPNTLAADFLFRHVHPLDPPGKTMLQLVDADTALRVDVFRAYGAIMARTLPLDFPFGPMRVISREEILARTARLLLDLRAGVPVAAKHAKDYLRLEKLMQTSEVEAAWEDHRRPDHPATFREANALVRGLIADHPDLLITPDYSRDASQMCSRCVASAEFPLADPHRILSLLGYC